MHRSVRVWLCGWIPTDRSGGFSLARKRVCWAPERVHRLFLPVRVCRGVCICGQSQSSSCSISGRCRISVCHIRWAAVWCGLCQCRETGLTGCCGWWSCWNGVSFSEGCGSVRDCGCYGPGPWYRESAGRYDRVVVAQAGCSRLYGLPCFPAPCHVSLRSVRRPAARSRSFQRDGMWVCLYGVCCYMNSS